MDFVYLDESGDVSYSESKGTRRFALSALIIPEESWNDVFTLFKRFRKYLSKKYGIPMYKEIHARDFLNGRGRPSKDRIINKHERVEIVKFFLTNFPRLVQEKGVYCINVCIENKPGLNSYDIAVDRMLNRIQRTLAKKNRQAILIFDEGKEHLIRRVTRKMRVFNPVPSMYGDWGNGKYTKNIMTDRVLGDPFFRNSEDDYFIQIVDLIVFCLLKKYEPPTPHVEKYEIHHLFKLLEPILYKRATKYNELGIVTK